MTDAPATTAAAPPMDDAGRTAVILDILARETGVPRGRLEPQASLADLEIASLDMVQTVFELETHFGIEIPVVPDRTGAEFETVGDLVNHVLTAIRDQSRA